MTQPDAEQNAAATLTLTELSERADVTPRTVRYYIQQGLLHAPGSGPKARYDERHVKLLRLVKDLQRQYLPLAEIRARLESLDDEGIDDLLAAPAPAEAGSAVDHIREVLEDKPGRLGEGPRQVFYNALLAPRDTPMPMPPMKPPPNTKPMSRSQWERLALGPDIELHIRRPLSRHQNRQVERIVAFARQLLEEDTP